MQFFGMTPDELVIAISAWATLGAGIVGVFVRVGRVLERLDGHERRIVRLEREHGIKVETSNVVKR